MLISAEADLRSPVPAITLRRTDIPDAPMVRAGLLRTTRDGTRRLLSIAA